MKLTARPTLLKVFEDAIWVDTSKRSERDRAKTITQTEIEYNYNDSGTSIDLRPFARISEIQSNNSRNPR